MDALLRAENNQKRNEKKVEKKRTAEERRPM